MFCRLNSLLKNLRKKNKTYKVRGLVALSDLKPSYNDVVTHAGVIHAITVHQLGTPVSRMYRVKVNNVDLTRIYYSFKGLC